MKKRFEIKFRMEIEAETLDKINELLKQKVNAKGISRFESKQLSGIRTEQQNAAIHLYFTQLAEALNDAGFDMKKTLKQGIAIPWTPSLIKELIWRPVMKTFLRKESTTEMNKSKDIDDCYDIINRTISERTGVSIVFPSIEELY